MLFFFLGRFSFKLRQMKLVGKDDTLLVNDHETHSSVFTQEEVVTWNMKAPWGRIAVNMVYYT